MTVAELIAALKALGPDARELPVVWLDPYFGPQEVRPRIDESATGEMRVRL